MVKRYIWTCSTIFKVEENATRVVKAVHENDYKSGTSKRKSSSVDDRKSCNKHDSDTKDKDDNQHELASEDGKVTLTQGS